MEELKENFRIICGTYEKLIYGINAFWGPLESEQEKLDTTSISPASNNKVLRLDPIFIYPSHISYVKCVGVGGHHMASGGTDEIIKLYDLKKRKEVGTLLQHSGTITCLTFFEKSHMLSAGEDGEICLWRTKDWERLTTFKGHKGNVPSVSIHPSGKLALSIGVDKTLRCWNLIEGKAAYTLKLYRKDGLKIHWNRTGTKYAIMFDQEVIVYDSMNPNQNISIGHKGRINDFNFFNIENKEYLITGCEDKKLRVYDISSQGKGKCILEWDNGSKSRVKCIDIMENDELVLLCTCSSDGIINVWDLNGIIERFEDEEEEEEKEEKDKKPENPNIGKELSDVEPIAKYETGCRITCMCFAPPIISTISENKTEEEEVKEEKEENEKEEEVKNEEEDKKNEKEEIEEEDNKNEKEDEKEEKKIIENKINNQKKKAKKNKKKRQAQNKIKKGNPKKIRNTKN